MEKILPLKVEGVDESPYAGFWLRLSALLLDMLILVPIIILILCALQFGGTEN